VVDDKSDVTQISSPDPFAFAHGWSSEFISITGVNASEENIVELVRWLGSRSTDAIQALLALHRLGRLRRSNADHYAQHLRMRCLSDLILVFESSLRRWQTGVVGELHERATDLLSPNVAARSALDVFQAARIAQYPTRAQRSTPQSVNWLVSNAWAALNAATTNAERCGIATYLAYGLRNSLMHVMEEQIDLYTNLNDLTRYAGIAFTLLQVSKFGSEGGIAAL
jgi:hypothetical protein